MRGRERGVFSTESEGEKDALKWDEKKICLFQRERGGGEKKSLNFTRLKNKILVSLSSERERERCFVSRLKKIVLIFFISEREREGGGFFYIFAYCYIYMCVL